MSIQVRCTSCERSFAVPDRFAGKQGKCPGCGHVLSVPANSDSLPPAGAPLTDTTLPNKQSGTQRFDPIAAPSAIAPPDAPANEPLTASGRRPAITRSGSKLSAAAATPARPAPSGNSASGSFPGVAGVGSVPGGSSLDFGAAPSARRGAPTSSSSKGNAVSPSGIGASAAMSSPISPSGTHARGRGAKPKQEVPVKVWIGLGIAFLVVAGGGGIFYAMSGGQPVAQAAPAIPPPAAAPPKQRGVGAMSEAAQATQLPELVIKKSRPPKPGPGADIKDIYKYIEYGIVKIECYMTTDPTEEPMSIGTGFIINEEGLVATNMHVVKHAARAVAVFNNQDRVEIAGYRAFGPDMDLALLQLASNHADMTPLDISYDEVPDKLEKVIAIGHPHGYEFQAFDGSVSSITKTSDLPDDAREFVESNLGNSIDLVWIGHRTGIAPGNSGGPLVDLQGRVLGVNTWVTTEPNIGYASHIRYVRQLMTRLTKTAEPLEKHQDKKGLPEQAKAPFTPKDIEELYATCEGLSWKPTSEEDYANMKKLGLMVTFSKDFARFAPPGTREPRELAGLVKASDSVIGKMRAFDWKSKMDVDALNKYAKRNLQSSSPGICLIGAVEKYMELNGAGTANAGAFITIDGSDQRIFVTCDRDDPVVKGQKVFVLGIVFGTTPYPDSPGRSKTATTILSKCTVPISNN